MPDLDASVNTFAIPYSALQSLNRELLFLTYGSLHGIGCTKYSHTL